MPYTNTYTKTTTYSVGGQVVGLSRTVTNTSPATGNERKLISEIIPSGHAGINQQTSGVIFSFNSDSGVFLGFSLGTTAGTRKKTVEISGAGWPYKITLNGDNNYCSFFAKTGNGFESSDGLAISNTSGPIYINNTGTPSGKVELIIETLGDSTDGWGT